MADMVKRFCNTFLVEGIFVLIVGMLLLILPQVSTLALSLMISVALILAGIYKFISSIIRRDEIEKSWLLIYSRKKSRSYKIPIILSISFL